MKPAVVTYSTIADHPGLIRLRNSMRARGWEEGSLRVLSSQWPGWVGRLKMVLSKIEQLRFDGFTHLIHVDAWDVICLGGPDEIAPAMADAGNPPMLMAAEAAPWPDYHRADKYPARQLPWWFCHSQYTIDLSQQVPIGLGVERDDEDDQRHLTSLYLAKTPGIVLDTKCRIIQSIAHNHPWENFHEIREDGRVYNKLTGTRPVFFHANGQTEAGWIPGWKL